MPVDADALAVLNLLNKLFAVRPALVERIPSTVEADLLGDCHEDRIVELLAKVFGPDLFVSLLLEEEQARENVHVRFDGENLDGQVDAGEHPTMPQQPPADVLIAGVAEDAIRQNDACPTTRLQPVEAAY